MTKREKIIPPIKPCPECESKRIEYDHIRAELVCRGCGLVLAAAYPYAAGRRIDYPRGLL